MLKVDIFLQVYLDQFDSLVVEELANAWSWRNHPGFEISNEDKCVSDILSFVLLVANMFI